MDLNSKKYIILWVYSKDGVVDKNETIAYGPYKTKEEAIDIMQIIGQQIAEMVQTDPDNHCIELNGKVVDESDSGDNIENTHVHTFSLDVVEMYAFQ